MRECVRTKESRKKNERRTEKGRKVYEQRKENNVKISCIFVNRKKGIKDGV